MRSILAIIAVLALLVPSLALTVHLVSHTHDDVGWLKTVDQYYSGQNNSIQHAGVNYILDSVMVALAENPDRKFSYVEQAFFQRWWSQQNEATRDMVRSFVKSGQLEFINGGWCMHDEAAAHYVDMIDQTTVGHKFLIEEFGAIPIVGWQIDPFGHSATQAALLSAEVGFDGLFFARIDYQDYNIRVANKELEMVWRASPSLGEAAQVFTYAFFQSNYGPPSDFCWDAVDCNDEPVQDDANLEDYNVQARVDDFIAQAMNQAAGTAGDLDTMNIMWNLGSDFMYEYAGEWFKNIDKIIEYVNKDGRVKALYSTPSMYVKAKNMEKVQWSVKTDDFFPYADGADSYWTGYFTSRPALKRYIRESSAFLQTVRQFEVLSASNGSASQRLWQSQGVVQHHDSVSGTSKQHVAYDYAKRVSIGMEGGAAFMTNLIGSQSNMNFSVCFLQNLSICATSQNNDNFLVALWNPQARNRTEVFTVPINSATATVYGPSGMIPSQVLLVPTNQASTSDSAKYAVAFQAELMSLAATGFAISTSASEHNMATMSVETPELTLTIQNEFVQLNFDATTGLLVNLTDLQTKTVYPFTQELAYYNGYQVPNDQDSGAYIFRPASNTAVPIRTDGAVKTTVINSGKLVQEVQQIFSSWATQIVRLRAGSPIVEFEWTIGPIDISDNQGKEVIVRYNSTLESNGVFYTDSNGREVLQRVRNERPTWKWDPTQLVAGNYYPVNGAVGLSDGTNALTVNVDRAEGCSSLADGSLECMVHRRLLMDDGRGVSEPLNETMGGILNDGTRLGEGLVITGTHYIHIGDSNLAYDVARPLQDSIFQPPVALYAPVASNNANNVELDSLEALASFQKGIDAMPFLLGSNVQFPVNVELMTVQAWNNGQVLVRLSHQFGVNEGKVYNVPATVDLQNVFSVPITAFVELSLTANQAVDNHKPLVWNTTSVETSKPRTRVPLSGTSVTLNPLEIRTFAVTLSN